MGQKKTERITQYEKARGFFGGSMFSVGLLDCARQNLQLSLDERKMPGRGAVWRDNHLSVHALAAIVMHFTAFDAWMMDGLTAAAMPAEPPYDLVKKSMYQRYELIPERLGGKRSPADLDLRDLSEVRDEIVHPLPRLLPDQGDVVRVVPEWLDRVKEQGLLLTTKDRTYGDVPGMQCASYALAYWAAGVVAAAANRFAANIKAEKGDSGLYQSTAANFENYKYVSIPPDRLSEYDEENGIREYSPEDK